MGRLTLLPGRTWFGNGHQIWADPTACIIVAAARRLWLRPRRRGRPSSHRGVPHVVEEYPVDARACDRLGCPAGVGRGPAESRRPETRIVPSSAWSFPLSWMAAPGQTASRASRGWERRTIGRRSRRNAARVGQWAPGRVDFARPAQAQCRSEPIGWKRLILVGRTQGFVQVP